MEQLTVEQWHERILAGWERYGTGTPLDPKTVEYLAVEFAKPMLPIPARELYPLQGMQPWPGFGSVWSNWPKWRNR
jgi:hypothetical protein